MATAIRPDEVTSVLRSELGGFSTETDVYEVGTVLQVGDGIARLYGLSQRPGRRAHRVPRLRRDGHGAQPRRGQRRRRALRRSQRGEGGRRGAPDRPHRLHPGLRRDARPRHRPARQPGRREGPHRRGEAGDAARAEGAGRDLPRARDRAAPDRHQGHRLDDPRRPRPARARHRRPADGQDGRPPRHHHQPEADARGGRQAGLLHLRRHRAEGLDGGAGACGRSKRRARSSTRSS